MTSQKQIIEILGMQIEGVPITEIAKRFNLSKGRISQLANRPESKRLKEMMLTRIAEATADDIIAERKKEETDVDSD